jgi:hypothetical protein
MHGKREAKEFVELLSRNQFSNVILEMIDALLKVEVKKWKMII